MIMQYIDTSSNRKDSCHLIVSPFMVIEKLLILEGYITFYGTICDYLAVFRLIVVGDARMAYGPFRNIIRIFDDPNENTKKFILHSTLFTNH